MFKLNTFISYLSLRFRAFPWLFLPLVFLFFSTTQLDQISILKIIYGIIFLISFRLFDDLMCINFDIAHKEKRFYYKNDHRKFLSMINALLFIILMFSVYLIFNQAVLYLHIAILLISFSLYQFLVQSKFIAIVSILKYPVLIYTLGDGMNASLLWGAIIFLILFFKELMDEKIIFDNKNIKRAMVTTAFLFKTYQWSNL